MGMREDWVVRAEEREAAEHAMRDEVLIDVEGTTVRVPRGADGHKLADGRVVRRQWGESCPVTLIGWKVEAALPCSRGASCAGPVGPACGASVPTGLTPEQAERYLDATTAMLRELIAAAGAEFHEVSILYSSIPYDDERRNRDGLELWSYTKSVYHSLIDHMSSWVGYGLVPVEPVGGAEAWRRGEVEAFRRSAPIFSAIGGAS